MPQQCNEDSGHLLDQEGFRNTLQKCMELLPEKCLLAIQFKYLEEKKAALICQELGISDTNYWPMLHRAKLQLRKCLEINCFEK